MEVSREIVVPAELDEVWAALTEPERLAEWFANDVELEPVPGGEGVFRWDDGDERRVLVQEVEPGRRFAFTWDDSRVAIDLEETEEGTRVVVSETLGSGWGTALELHALALVMV